MSPDESGRRKHTPSRVHREQHNRRARLVRHLVSAAVLGAALYVSTLGSTPSQENPRTLTGHSSLVTTVSFSPDGRVLASGSYDETIKLWDVTTGQVLRTLTGHAGAVRSTAFSPDGKMLASGSYDKTIKLWNVATGQVQRTFTGHADQVNSVAFSPDGTTLASGSWDQTVKLWDVATGHVLSTLTERTVSSVNSVVFSPDGKMLAAGSSDRKIRLWDVATTQLMRTATGHADLVCSVAFSPDGKMLVSGSSDTTVKLWDVATGRILGTATGHTESVWSVAFSPDGAVLASASIDKTVRLWDTATRKLLRAATGQIGPVWSVAFSPDGAVLASGSADNTIYLWSVTAVLSQPPCLGFYSISPTHVDVPYAGATGIIDVIADSGCSWEALSDSTWIHLTLGDTGSGTVGYSVDANPGSGVRIGTVTVAGKTCTIDQKGAPTSQAASPGSTYEITAIRWRVAGYGEGQQTTTVRVEVEVKNVGSRATSSTTVWVGAIQFGDLCAGYAWTWDQEKSNSIDLQPGQIVTWTVDLTCPTNEWAQIGVRVSDLQGGSACRVGHDFYI